MFLFLEYYALLYRISLKIQNIGIIKGEKRQSLHFSEELSFLLNLPQILAILQMIRIVIEAIIDQTMDAISSAMFGRNVRTEIAL